MAWMPIERAQRKSPPEGAAPFSLRFLGAILRIAFIALLLVVTVRVSLPQNETIWTVYDTPGDLIRMALGFMVCLWIVFQFFSAPKDAHSHRTWLYIGAVALPVSQQELLERHAGGHPFAASAPHVPAGAIGAVENTGVAKPDAGLIRQSSLPPSASPGVGSPVLNRGISGTSVSHRGVKPSGVGGPPKTAAGINGTTIRSTH